MAKKKRIAAKKAVQVKTRTKASKKKVAHKKKKTAKKATTTNGAISKRLVIHTHDITKILGINIRTAQRLLQTIRETLGRQKGYVSIREFAEYVHLEEEDVKKNLDETVLS
jgi:transposase-like protein